MKSWQNGVEMDRLRELTAPFTKSFRAHSYGAFGMVKERDVATAISKHQLIWHGSPGHGVDAAAIARVVTSRSTQHDFAKRRIRLAPGDVYVSALAGTCDGMARILTELDRRAGGRAIWIELHEERTDAVALLEHAGWRWAATKVSAGSDIKGMYLRRAEPGARVDPYSVADGPGLQMLASRFLSEATIRRVQAEIAGVTIWEQHYSSYNKRSSWTALALRGFDPNDPGFIIKPSEMSKQWRAENLRRITASCGTTSLGRHLPQLMSIVDALPGIKERVRLMKLAGGNGELSRHADITDRDAGTRNGEIARLHLPLTTSPDCVFSTWDQRGERHRQHFDAGQLFYLDVRKPHSVVNPGEQDRVHLVVDCVVGEHLRRWIATGRYDA